MYLCNGLQTYPRQNGAGAKLTYVNDITSHGGSTSTDTTPSRGSLVAPEQKHNGDIHSASVSSLKPFTCPSDTSLLRIEEMNQGITLYTVLM